MTKKRTSLTLSDLALKRAKERKDALGYDSVSEYIEFLILEDERQKRAHHVIRDSDGIRYQANSIDEAEPPITESKDPASDHEKDEWGAYFGELDKARWQIQKLINTVPLDLILTQQNDQLDGARAELARLQERKEDITSGREEELFPGFLDQIETAIDNVKIQIADLANPLPRTASSSIFDEEANYNPFDSIKKSLVTGLEIVGGGKSHKDLPPDSIRKLEETAKRIGQGKPVDFGLLDSLYSGRVAESNDSDDDGLSNLPAPGNIAAKKA